MSQVYYPNGQDKTELTLAIYVHHNEHKGIALYSESEGFVFGPGMRGQTVLKRLDAGTELYIPPILKKFYAEPMNMSGVSQEDADFEMTKRGFELAEEFCLHYRVVVERAYLVLSNRTTIIPMRTSFAEFGDFWINSVGGLRLLGDTGSVNSWGAY